MGIFAGLGRKAGSLQKQAVLQAATAHSGPLGIVSALSLPTAATVQLLKLRAALMQQRHLQALFQMMPPLEQQVLSAHLQHSNQLTSRRLP